MRQRGAEEVERNSVVIIVARQDLLKTSGYSRCPLLGPQSDVYLAWSRGGLGEHERRRPGTAQLFEEALSLTDTDQLVAKLRYRF